MRVIVVAALLGCGALAQEPCTVHDGRAALTIPHVSGRPELSTDTAAAEWGTAAAAGLDKDCSKVLEYPALRTTVRGFWTDTHLYLLFACPYQRLNLFLPRQGSGDRDKLWDREVVEMVLGADGESIRR